MNSFLITPENEELSKLVDSQTLIEKDSPYELEIRIATIRAVEMIKGILIKNIFDL